MRVYKTIPAEVRFWQKVRQLATGGSTWRRDPLTRTLTGV